MSKQYGKYLLIVSVIFIAFITLGEGDAHSVLISYLNACLAYIENKNAIVTAVATIAIAAFTLQLWISTDKLWLAGENQLEHLRDTSRRELRAYVGVDEMPSAEDRKIIFDKDAGEIKVNAFAKNYGNTPAYEFHPRVLIDYLDFPFPATKFPDVEYGNGSVLQPSQHVILASKKTGINHSAWQNIRHEKSLKKRLYVYGYISYTDAFKLRHFTKFCFIVGRWDEKTGIPAWDVHDPYDDTDDSPRHQ